MMFRITRGQWPSKCASWLRRAAVLALMSSGTLVCAAAQDPATPPPSPPPPPPGMVLVPAGEFMMGTDDPALNPNERPSHRVRLSAFYMDATPVTNAQFRAFAEATGYQTIAERPIDWEELKKQVPEGTPKPADELLQPGSLVFTPPPAGQEVDTRNLGNWWQWVTGASWKTPEGPGSSIEGKDDYPVVQIAWDDAVAYAKWAGKRLPTEAEWEYACRGGLDGTRFYWGDSLLVDGKHRINTFQGTFPSMNTAEDGYPGTSPVKAFSPNNYGLYDMAGNVWNWCSDIYRADVHRIAAEEGVSINPQGPREAFNPTREMPASMERVIKGGSFLCHVSYCESYRPTARRGTPPDTGSSHVGFRCVIDVEPTRPADGAKVPE